MATELPTNLTPLRVKSHRARSKMTALVGRDSILEYASLRDEHIYYVLDDYRIDEVLAIAGINRARIKKDTLYFTAWR